MTATLQVINSLRLNTERFVMAFLKVNIDFHPTTSMDLPEAIRELVEVLACFVPQAYFKIKIEPKVRIEEFTPDEMRQIAEFIVGNDYFAPMSKFFYQVISRNDLDGNDFCTVLDYIDQAGLEVAVTDPQKVGEEVLSKNPIHRVMDFYLDTGP